MKFKSKVRKFLKSKPIIYALLKKPSKYFFNKKMKWKRDGIENYGMECLLIIKETFQKHDQEFWLDYGTLLGAIRERNFISHDLDMDIGTFNIDEEKKVELERALNERGLETIREFRINDLIVEQTFIYKGAHVDIFYYYKKESSKIWCYFFEGTDKLVASDKDGYKMVKGWKTKTATSSYLGNMNIIFKGEEFPIPSNYEQYLIENYGHNYMIKDDNWDYANSGKNIEMVEVGEVRAIYRSAQTFAELQI